MVTPLLRAESLVRRYSGRTVLDLEGLVLHRGEVLSVLGPNGAGKSTLFRLLLLLEHPDAGRVFVHGRPAVPGDRAAALCMAGVFQRPWLFDGTVEHNVEFGLRARGVARAERTRRVAATLAWLGLEPLAVSHVRALSGGEAQRVALARALVVAPDILLLDEPTASLDVTVQRRFREDLERTARHQAGGVLLITHDPADAFALADRIAVLEDGHIVQTGTPDELAISPATPFVAALTGAELLLDGTVAEVDDGLVCVRLIDACVIWAVPMQGSALRRGEAVHVAYRPEDVTLAAAGARVETSAINRFDGVVASLVPSGALVRVRLSGAVGLAALVTRRSAEALGLHPGGAVSARLKATAVRAFPATARHRHAP